MPMTQDELFEAFEHMNAGVFLEQIRHGLSEAALSTAVHGDKGKKTKVKIEFALERIANSQELHIVHSLSYEKLTAHGRITETTSSDTAMHCKKGGVLTVFSEDQEDMFNPAKQ